MVHYVSDTDEPALKHRRVDVDFDVNSGTSVKVTVLYDILSQFKGLSFPLA